MKPLVPEDLRGDPIKRARATLERLGRGAELRQQDRAKIMQRARENVVRAKEQAHLRRDAEQAGRTALAAYWRALASHDRQRGFAPTVAERRERDVVEATLKRLAGLA